MATPVVVASNQASNGYTTAPVVETPPGWADDGNNYHLIGVTWADEDATSGQVTLPGGFTEVGRHNVAGHMVIALGYLALTSAPADDYTFGSHEGVADGGGVLILVRGCVSGDPFRVAPTFSGTNNPTESNPVTAASITGTADDLLLGVFGRDHGGVSTITWTAPGGMSLAGGSDLARWASCQIYQQDLTSSGATGVRDATHSQSSGSPRSEAAALLSLQPDPDVVDVPYLRWQDHAPAEWDQDDTTFPNRSETAYTDARPIVAVRFIAPSSGRVIVTVGGGVRDSANLERLTLAPHVWQAFDTEADVLTPDQVANGFCAGPETTDFFFGQRSVVVSNLIPGRRYVARPKYAVDGGATADLACRDMLVEPDRPGGIGLAGDLVRAVDVPETVQAFEGTDNTDITATVFAAADPPCEVDFVAPTSGRVAVTVGGSVRQGGSGERAFISFRITNNAGTPAFVEGPGTGRYSFSGLDGTTGLVVGSRTVLIDRLEAGGSYNAAVYERASVSGGADIAFRQILVEPV